MSRHGPITIQTFNDAIFGANGMIVSLVERPDCWLVDPGLPPQAAEMIAHIRSARSEPRAILLTHGHPDHIAGIPELRQEFPELPVMCPRGEESLLTDAAANLSAGMGMPIVVPAPDSLLAAGEALHLGPSVWKCVDVAGHSPAALAFHCEEAAVVLVGDAVFADSIGRTDFPHSDHDRLLRNIRDHILTLPEETIVYPGHGPPASVARIRRHNLLLRELLGIRS